MTTEIQEIVSVGFAAKILRMSRQGLALQIKKGTVLVAPCSRQRSRYFFDKAAVERAAALTNPGSQITP